MNSDMRVFIDTNVLIDYFGKREQFYHETIKLKAAAFFGGLEIWAAAHSFTDVFYILNKEHKSRMIQDMFLSSKEFLSICSLAPDDIFTAAQENWSDFEDCLIHQCALKTKAQYLITRDARGFAQAHLPSLAPADFLELFEEQTGISFDSVTA